MFLRVGKYFDNLDILGRLRLIGESRELRVVLVRLTSSAPRRVSSRLPPDPCQVDDCSERPAMIACAQEGARHEKAFQF